MEDGKKRAMDKVEELHRRKADVALGGGQAKIDQVHKAGRLTARERVDRFFDPGTFVEIDAFGRTLGKDFGMDKVSVPADGVITGFGKVNGRTVCIVAQDYTAMAGTFGEMHGKKIVKITEIASNM
ncbi:MAG: hypothetical protein HYX97_04640, partial [Chloroflexi bacterium]|nr:hypothetical protein [Chloroflexota bacterium]